MGITDLKSAVVHTGTLCFFVFYIFFVSFMVVVVVVVVRALCDVPVG